jgi:hypothetical protein
MDIDALRALLESAFQKTDDQGTGQLTLPQVGGVKCVTNGGDV